MKTTWKEIAPVPTSQEFLDVVLSRTQRRLPTQIRSGFKISRIRGSDSHNELKRNPTDLSKLSTLERLNILKRHSPKSYPPFSRGFRAYKTFIHSVSDRS